MQRRSKSASHKKEIKNSPLTIRAPLCFAHGSREAGAPKFDPRRYFRLFEPTFGLREELRRKEGYGRPTRLHRFKLLHLFLLGRYYLHYVPPCDKPRLTPRAIGAQPDAVIMSRDPSATAERRGGHEVTWYTIHSAGLAGIARSGRNASRKG